MSFNIIDIEPVRTYATRENAIKAVQKKFCGIVDGPRMFNVVIMERRNPPPGPDGVRYFPLLCNIREEFFQQAIHCGFNIIN